MKALLFKNLFIHISMSNESPPLHTKTILIYTYFPCMVCAIRLKHLGDIYVQRKC